MVVAVQPKQETSKRSAETGRPIQASRERSARQDRSAGTGQPREVRRQVSLNMSAGTGQPGQVSLYKSAWAGQHKSAWIKEPG
jgi:hypothetical protein